MSQAAVETEVKIAIPGRRTEVARKIEGAGFRPSVERIFEANTLYDDSTQSLRTRGVILRLRRAGAQTVITFKGPSEPGPYKSREELETTTGSFEALQTILDRLGFRPVFRYEKYRTEFRTPETEIGTVTLDETPIGDFLELEGPGEWIDQTAARLGFSAADYILDSYGKLYLAHCERLGLQPGHMVFSS